MGSKMDVGGQVRALRWADGASGALTGSLEGLYEAFRCDDGEGSSFVLELAHGDLALEVDLRHCGDTRPPSPDEHPFARASTGTGTGTPLASGPVLPLPASRGGASAEAGTVALTVLPDASSGIFAGARGEIVVAVPDYREGGSLVVHTDAGELWMDYLERHVARGRLQTDLWVDGSRSTGAWRGAGGKLQFTLEVHPPNAAVGWYTGTFTLPPPVEAGHGRELVETS